jgi:hypothetical protein
MSDYYQIVPVGTAQTDSDAILATLQAIKDGQLVNDLRLLNYYHEIPVSYGATVDFIEGDMVDFGVHQHQAVVMKLEKSTIIKSRHFPHEVIANVFRSDITRCLVTLTKFAYGVVRAERRRFVRVAVTDAVDVVFLTDTATISGRMTDISVGGVSIRQEQECGAIDVGCRGIARLSLQGTPLEMPARLIKILADAGQFKYVFELDTSSREEAVISRFIFQRQVEIIRELKDHIV